MRKLLLSLTLIILLITNSFINVKALPAPPNISAEGGVILDAQTGSILYSKNIDTPYAPASTTKLMTALLTLEHCKLDDSLTVGKKPPLADGSKIYLFEGEQLKIRDVLTALLLASANDCAEALAEHIGGSIEGFAKMMNEKAKSLGCKNTHFVNPSGLYDDNHRTTAKDLALISRELFKYPEFFKIATIQSATINPTNKSANPRPLWNENRLLQQGSNFYYKYCIAGKTGYTVQSLHSYVAFGKKDNHTLVTVLLHDPTCTRAYYTDAANLLEYGFNNFTITKLYSKGDVVSNYNLDDEVKVPLTASKDFYYVHPKDEKEVKPTSTLKKTKTFSDTSFKKGDNIFNATIKAGDKTVGDLNLLSNISYEKKTIKSAALSLSLTTKLAISAGILIVLILILLLIFKRRKPKKSYTNSHRRYRSNFRR
jgi:D-alanyl-D-alanine carboxypeptidase (penicillin-binding protein 5/6)